MYLIFCTIGFRNISLSYENRICSQFSLAWRPEWMSNLPPPGAWWQDAEGEFCLVRESRYFIDKCLRQHSKYNKPENFPQTAEYLRKFYKFPEDKALTKFYRNLERVIFKAQLQRTMVSLMFSQMSTLIWGMEIFFK